MILKNKNSRCSVRRTLSLSEEVNRDLELYAAALESSPNWVVNQVLTRFFAKDKEFQEWKASRLPQEEKAVFSQSKTSKKKTIEVEVSPASS